MARSSGDIEGQVALEYFLLAALVMLLSLIPLTNMDEEVMASMQRLFQSAQANIRADQVGQSDRWPDPIPTPDPDPSVPGCRQCPALP